MKINIEIKSIQQWYRDSTKEWCITVVYWTDNVSGSITYSNKKLNKAKKSMFMNLHKDILEDEIMYRAKMGELKIDVMNNQ